MASFSVVTDSKGIQSLSERIQRVAKDLPDAKVLGTKIEADLRAGNEADRRAGRNRWGHAMPKIKVPETQEARDRQGRGRGPYLAPGPGRNSRESRVIANYFTAIAASAKRGFSIVFGWKDVPWLRYYLNRAATDIGGISPQTGKRISATIRQHLKGVFER